MNRTKFFFKKYYSKLNVQNTVMKSYLKPTLFILGTTVVTFVGSSLLKTTIIKNRNDRKMVIYGIIGVNFIVFLLWNASFRIPKLYHFMRNNFEINPSSKLITLLTSGFSHQTLLHFSFNMIAFYSFGSSIQERLGTPYFLTSYIFAILFSSYFSVLFKIINHISIRYEQFS
jgi:membrane associated rhomboid family serine protease